MLNMETFKRKKTVEKYFRDIFMASVGFKIVKYSNMCVCMYTKVRLIFRFLLQKKKIILSYFTHIIHTYIWIVWKNIGGVFMEICNGYKCMGKKLDFRDFYLLKHRSKFYAI